jgi:hypothetical protein
MANALTTNELNHNILSGAWAFICFGLDESLNEYAVYSDRSGDGVPVEVWVDSVPTLGQDWTYTVVLPGSRPIRPILHESSH